MSSATIVQSIVTIQGEGPNVGKPCLLFRVGGCNLHCDFCDTWDLLTGKKRAFVLPQIKQALNQGKLDETSYNSVLPVILKILQNHTSPFGTLPLMLMVTGGEPLRKENYEIILQLVRDVVERNHTVEIETNGVGITDYDTIFDAVVELAQGIENGRLNINISPKFTKSFYPSPAVYARFTNQFFNKMLKLLEVADSLDKFDFTLKFVLDDKNKQHIEFIRTKIPELLKKVYVMPLTPYNPDGKIVEGLWKKNQLETAKYAIEVGCRYSPRIHIDMFKSEQINEFQEESV